MEDQTFTAIVDLLDKIGTIGILVAAWLWERRERVAITTAYIEDMRRFSRHGAGHLPTTDAEIENPPIKLG